MGRESTILEEANPWWRDAGAELQDVLPYRRQPAFDRVLSGLFRGDRRRGTLLIGLRWIGKTELAKQVAAATREDRLPGTQLAYVRVDQPRLRGSLSIDEVLTAWDPYRRTDTPSLLIVDEAHRLSDPTPDSSWGWARQLKGVVDDGQIAVLATGSDAGRLLDGAGEGAGRWEYVELEPLSFREFRELRSPRIGESPLEVTRHQDLSSYLRVGGFPGFATSTQHRQAMEGIQHYAREVLLDELGGIRQIAKVERAFAILMDMSGANLDASSLSKSIGAKAETIERWLSALESVRLIQRVPRIRAVDRSVLHVVRGQPKVHGTDPGLVAAFSRWSDPMADANSRGSLYEAAVLRHLREVARTSNSAIYCLQLPDRRGKKSEVDFVLVHGDDEMFLVEVTSGTSEFEDKARFLRDVGADRDICGPRRVHGVVVGPSDRSTRSDVPVVDVARFMEAIIPTEEGDLLERLRELSTVVGGE